MSIEKLIAEGGPLHVLAGALAGGGIIAAFFRYLGTRTRTQPDLLQQGGAMVAKAFAEMSAQLDRHKEREDELEALIQTLRQDRHELANRLAVLQGRVLPLEIWALQCRDVLLAHGLQPPAFPPGLTFPDREHSPPA